MTVTAPRGYVWKSGRSFPVAAEVVGKVVDRIAAIDGGCSPSRLVDEARPADSPIHPLFEWDDSSAAESWRQHQARHVIASIRVVDESPDEDGPPAYVTVRYAVEDDAADGYAPRAIVVQNVDTRHEVIMREWAQIRGWLDRTAWIDEFQPLRDAVPAVVELLGID